MASLPEIVAPGDTPSDLITVVDETTVRAEVEAWRARMLKRPGLWDKATRGTQDRINRIIPEKVHAIVTSGVEAMTKGILFGSDLIQTRPRSDGSLAARELRARAMIKTYRNTASVEGGVAGAGGFVLAAADFPALMAIKVRMLGDVVGAYGWGGDTVRERLFLLHIFHLAFASARRRPEALAELERWIAGVDQPETITEYDWRRFPDRVPGLHRPGQAGPADPGGRRAGRGGGQLAAGRTARRDGDDGLPDALVRTT